MATWTLNVYTPTGGPHVPSSLIASYSNSSPGGIVEGFQWSCAPHGDCLQLEFSAVPKLVNIPPRYMVQLVVNGTPAFYGYISRGWYATSGRAERYTAIGAAQLLRQRYANVTITGSTEIAGIVNQVMAFKHPAINYTGTPPNTGYTLSTFKAPWVDIATILKDLAAAAGGVSWGVRPDATFYFQSVSSVRATSYVTANLRYLPVEAAEVWDIVRLIHPATGATYTYNAGFGLSAEKAVLVPNMPDYMDRLSGTFSASHNISNLDNSSVTGGINPDWLYDRDPTTGYVFYYDPPSGLICLPFVTTRGCIFTFTPTPGQLLLWQVDAGLVPLEAPNYPQARTLNILLSHSQSGPSLLSYFELKDGYTYVPSNIETGYNSAFYVGAQVNNSCTPYRLAVRRFAVYTPGATLQRFASALTQNFYQSPSEIHIPGYVPPTTLLTLLNTPSGDVTNPVGRWEYRYTIGEGLYSIARSGASGIGPEAEAIRILANVVSSEGDTRLRW
jgi:hypothetical protein